ncbi:MAG TPA: SH3 domain-containing protein [Leptolyngbyaceae cyanobacterium M65_K2018_010]|nr:SH3 domain-containing protein [Leptolyngbyaceae cyanobacterium M65_K2018_010]
MLLGRWRGKQHWMGWGLTLVLITLASGCGSSPEPETEASPSVTQETATPSPAVTDSPAEETIGGFRATVIDPPRVTQLATQNTGSQINLRSQPTTLSPILGQGQAGDPVRLLRLAEGEAGYSWYYVQFTQSEQEGWVRGDFVDTANATAAAPESSPSTAQPVVARATQPCGGDRQEAHFESPSLTIYLCQTAQGVRFIGTNKTTQESLVTDDVTNNQGIYIAIDGNLQYHVSDTAIAVYQVSNGSYSQLKGEPVQSFERFVY